MIKKSLIFIFIVFFALIASATADRNEKLAGLEKRIADYQVNPAFKDDAMGFGVVKSALESIQEGSGGIGACLVDKSSGRIVAYGRNRQTSPYFRSDLHAEMDLLNRYEDRVKKGNDAKTRKNPRECKNLVLVTSVEPCPMCLTRIINSGIKTVRYMVEDKAGGMVTRLDHLPPFWREFAADRKFLQADCSPELRQIALDLFNFSSRNFAQNRQKNK
ncbi:MAG: nucleoside deaminase [Proteobacteria bacterium]|nr:nucleoside deaminase [Pseudomonadota bacterium]MBU1583104.1 nucleoside deaminase [Pseudomonadota bacterium]MBU2455697.1 nucleoside deaminase [Pseudomonadota bacterium]MBU2629369.1 nucleoside deaminase [Pseudomonadota bacterium]